jgi:hypothetical protein
VLGAAQVAASLILLASAGVIYGAFQRTLNVSLGFDPRRLSYAFADARAPVWTPRGATPIFAR